MRTLGFDKYDENEYAAVPETTIEAIRRYIEHGILPGDFLQAVIQNDLTEAVGRADRHNLPALKLICQMFYNCTPADSHGNKEKMLAWARVGGTEGLRGRPEPK